MSGASVESIQVDGRGNGVPNVNLVRFAHNDNCCSVRCELIKLVQDELTILRMLSLSYAELEEMNEQCAIGFVDEANWKRYEVVAYERWWWSPYVHAMMKNNISYIYATTSTTVGEYSGWKKECRNPGSNQRP